MELEAAGKAAADVMGKVVIPGLLGDKPKGKSAAGVFKVTVIPIRARRLKLRPAVERILEIDLSRRTERLITRSLRKGKRPALKVSASVGKGARNRDGARIGFGL